MRALCVREGVHEGNERMPPAAPACPDQRPHPIHTIPPHPPARISFLRWSVTGAGGGAGAGKGSSPTNGRRRSSARPRNRRCVSRGVMLRPAASAASPRRNSIVFWAAAGAPSAAATTEASSSRLMRPVMRSPAALRGGTGWGAQGGK